MSSKISYFKQIKKHFPKVPSVQFHRKKDANHKPNLTEICRLDILQPNR